MDVGPAALQAGDGGRRGRAAPTRASTGGPHPGAARRAQSRSPRHWKEACDEGQLLGRQAEGPGRGRARPQDPQLARRHRADHVHRDLRLGPAPLQRLRPHHGEGRHPGPRVHGRGGGGRGRASRTSRSGDRVVVPFPIACGNCAMCRRDLFSLCENSNPNAWMAEKLWGHSPAGHLRLLAPARRLRRRPGGVRPRAVRRRGPAQGARTGSPTSRCCSSRTSSRPATWAPRCATSSRATSIAVWGCGPGGAVRHRQRQAARRRAGHRDRPLPLPAAAWRGSAPAHGHDQLRGGQRARGAAGADRRTRARRLHRRGRHGGARPRRRCTPTTGPSRR